jgi:hypothetical protein
MSTSLLERSKLPESGSPFTRPLCKEDRERRDSPPPYGLPGLLPEDYCPQLPCESEIPAREDLSLRRKQDTGDPAHSMPDSLGPRSLPLFFTALHQSPGRLVWGPIPGAIGYRVHIGLLEDEGCHAPLFTTLTPVNARAVDLSNALKLEPGRLYTWQVEPLYTWQVEFLFSEEPMPVEPETQAISLPENRPAASLQGCFWLLDADQTARLERGRHNLDKGTDPQFARIARALLMAELGLYQDALIHIQKSAGASVRPAHTLLISTVRALIYRQMALTLEQGSQPGASGSARLSRFLTWAQNREQYYRQQAALQMTKGG